MRRWVPFGLCLLCLASRAASAEQNGTELHQPIESRSNLVLHTAMGEASIDRDGGRSQRIAVRKNELLTTIAETRSGWTAAGIKQVRDGSDLIVISRDSQGTQRLPSPQVQRHDLRLRPTLLVSDEQMRGLAWLEGTDLTSLSVRASEHLAGEWDDATVVAPPAKGSQTGLVAAALSDGSWLLAWSAFDGTDDDILWSRGHSGQWSPARRVAPNNSTPDVTPSLVATDNGALLAWSRLTGGQYEVVLARFDGASWSQPAPIGPSGSVEPRFVLKDDVLHLLYHHAWPAGWAVAELAPNGRMQRVAILAEDQASSPVLLRSSSRAVELKWPNQGLRSQTWEAVP